MTTILARLQAATGPDREIDAAIVLHLGWKKNQSGSIWCAPDGTWYSLPLAFTGLLDAARTLVAPGRFYVVGVGADGFFAAIGDGVSPYLNIVSGKTDIIALCTAWAAETGA